MLEYQLFQIGGYSLTIWRVLSVLLIWAAVWLVLRVVRRVINRGLERVVWDQGRRHSLFLIVQYLVWLLAAMGMMEVVGISISVLVAGSAAFLVGLGLGLQQIFRDIASGVFLLFEGTIEVGDVLQVDGTVGRVVEINLRTSKLQTRDGMMMIVPNHKFITERVINWSHQNEEPSKFNIVVLTHYNTDEQLVARLLLECAREHANVLNDDPMRPPQARLAEFGKEEMTFELHFWTHRKFEVDGVRSELRYAVREKFRQHGIRPPEDGEKNKSVPGTKRDLEEVPAVKGEE